MATRTSSQTGNWSDTATWSGAAAPGDGDRAVIAHAVTVTANVTVGLSLCASPMAKPTLAATGSGGALPAGTYRVKYTNVGSTGETGTSAESSTVTITAGQLVRVTLPARPTGVDSRTIYLTDTNGSANTERKYRTGVTATTTDLDVSQWEDDTVAFSSATATPANTHAIEITAGSLTVNAGITLVIRGDVLQANVVCTFEAGSILEFDAQNSPSDAAVYDWRMGTSSAQTTIRLRTNGTSGSRCAIRSNSAGANGRILSNEMTSVNGEALLDLEYTDFLRVGSSTLEAIHVRQTVAYKQLIDNCVFDTCGPLRVTASSGATIGYGITNCSWKSCAAFVSPGGTGNTVCLWISHSGTNAATEDRDVSGCIFPVFCGIPQHGAIFDNCIFYDTWDNVSGSATAASEIKNSLIRLDNNSGQSTGCIALFEDCYAIADGSMVNPHYFNVGVIQAYRRVTMETNGGAPDGEFVKTFNSGSAVTVEHCLIIPNADNESSGALMTMFNNTVGTLTARHNTYCNVLSSAHINEGGVMPAGKVLEFKSNLAWSPNGTSHSGAGGYKIHDISSTILTNADDIVSPSVCTNNYMWNGRAGIGDVSDGIGYNFNTSTSPGANDVDETGGTGPNFVDSTRNFVTWGESLGITGADDAAKTANILIELMKRNEAGYNSDYSVAALNTYVRAGFVPQNAALQNAGHDAVTIGAMEGIFGGAAPLPLIGGGLIGGGLINKGLAV